MFNIKDKTPTKHWIINSLMKSIDVDELFNRRVIIIELEASLNGDDTLYTSGII